MSNTFSRGGEKSFNRGSPPPSYGPGDDVVKSNLFAD